MKIKKPSSPRILVGIALMATGLASVFAAGESVTIDVIGGGGLSPYFSDSAGTAQDGWTIRVGSFVSSNQSTVEALGYNLLWVNNQFTLFGNGTTETLLDQAGSFDPSPNLTNSSDALKGQQAWLVYSDSSALTAATSYGVASSSSADWTIPNASPWTTLIATSELTVAAYGTFTGNTSSDSVRTAATPVGSLYWDSNGGAGRGGSGTWSSSVADTEWTTNSSGVAADGTYAWGSTSGSAYYAGAGLTANFGGDAGTVSVSGTVETRHGIRIEAAYTISSGTVSLAGANATANTVEVTTGNTGTVTAALSGSNGLTKSGEGTLVLQADNSALTGAVAVTNGTLQANATNALGGATSVTVSTGGSFLISEDNAVNNSASVTLAGGTLAMGGTTTDTVGTLTLTANSIIDLGTFSGNLIFANSSAINWTGGTMLSIWNWNGTNMYGTSYGAGDRHIFVGNSSAGLTQNQLNSISFYSDSGNSFIGTGFIDSTGEIGAVPEPEAIITATVLLAGIGVYWLRRRRANAAALRAWDELAMPPRES